MPALLCLCLLIVATPAAAGTAVCEVDLETGIFAWTAPDGRQLEPQHLPDAAPLFEQLAVALTAGDTADSLRTRIGRAVVSPVWAEISGASAWRVASHEAHALPGPLGAFGVIVLPDGRAAIEHAAVTLDWPLPAPPLDSRSNERSGVLLLSAPFTADVDPATDDPDTLRHALAKAARSVRLIPRNETSAATLRRALEDVRPAVWWFRGEPHALAAMEPAFGALPDVVVWTLPSRSSLSPPELGPMTLASDGRAPSCVVVATHSILETALAPMARNFADGLARGLDCATALHEAQLAALDAGLDVASSLVLIGDPTTTAKLARAPWLRRLFR